MKTNNENMDKMKDIYDKTFDYEDMKIAFCIQEFIDSNKLDIEELELTDYEDLVWLAREIHNNWYIDKDFDNLSQEEFAYIQVYAYRYLKEKYLEA